MNSEVEGWWKHVDHELWQLLRLHHAFRDPGFSDLPEIARRSMDVAYGAHLRAILEFAHARTRPRNEDWETQGVSREGRGDITAQELLGEAVREDWSAEELIRLQDADKLIGHLTAGRVIREGMQREWGDDLDWRILEPIADRLVSEHGDKLPRSTSAWRSLDSGLSGPDYRQRLVWALIGALVAVIAMRLA